LVDKEMEPVDASSGTPAAPASGPPPPPDVAHLRAAGARERRSQSMCGRGYVG